MPALVSSRQPFALGWFASAQGGQLLAAEQAAVAEALASRPAQPWLRLAAAPVPALAASPAGRRGLTLHRVGRGFRGDLVCGLSLPLATESIGSVIVQHAEAEGGDALLDECARVLAPGGRLWLFTLNPWSPYRVRWRGHGLRVRDAMGWGRAMDRLGLDLEAGPPRFLGPVWRPAAGAAQSGRSARWRAVCVYQAEKRSAAPALPKPAPRWRTHSSLA